MYQPFSLSVICNKKQSENRFYRHEEYLLYLLELPSSPNQHFRLQESYHLPDRGFLILVFLNSNFEFQPVNKQDLLLGI